MSPQLTLEQQFQYLQMKQAAENLEKMQLLELLVDATRQLSIKTNLYLSLAKNKKLIGEEFDLTLEQSLRCRMMEEELRQESKAEIINRLLETMSQIMTRDNSVKQLLMDSCRW
jgi:hypothetical protein